MEVEISTPIPITDRIALSFPMTSVPRELFQSQEAISVSVPTLAVISPTSPPDTPVATAISLTPAPTLIETPIQTPPQEQAVASEPPQVALPAPTESPTESPTAPPTATVTATPRATRTPIDVARIIYTNLPPVFVGASVLLFAVIIAAGVSIVRGPRDI
jgi:hypothetical protein